ncbi:MAG: hypothetical protein LBK25_01650 [Treponema sp.]|nr:hypothetical protein [Treponema sp.]
MIFKNLLTFLEKLLMILEDLLMSFTPQRNLFPNGQPCLTPQRNLSPNRWSSLYPSRISPKKRRIF